MFTQVFAANMFGNVTHHFYLRRAFRSFFNVIANRSQQNVGYLQ